MANPTIERQKANAIAKSNGNQQVFSRNLVASVL